MIGFNGKYLAAAIGDMRITAMSQGDKWLIDNRWLMLATQAAILSAFGAEEGAGVIQATNAYLNGLATTDREKAQALAGFINEDPMLVCSIVETSKTRWLVGDGSAWLDTNFCANGTTYAVEIKWKRNGPQSSNWRSLSGVNIGSSGEKQYCLFQFNDANETNLVYHNSDKNTSISKSLAGTTSFVARMELANNVTTCFFDGEKVGEIADTIAYDPHYTYPLFAAKSNSTTVITPLTKGGLGWFKFEEEGNDHHFVPFRRNGEMELLDILTGTLATRVGTFTEIIEDKQ